VHRPDLKREIAKSQKKNCQTATEKSQTTKKLAKPQNNGPERSGET
jgi:hypothetical protein